MEKNNREESRKTKNKDDRRIRNVRKNILSKVIAKVEIEYKLTRLECKKKKIEFVYGSGKKKTEEQIKSEHLEKVIERFNTYKTHSEIMEERNSYSKTDHDATFMRMKEDHMLNGQLKPAYNVQLATSGEFIIGVMGSQKASDINTLKPFLEQMLPRYGEHIISLCADAGYESVENYTCLAEKSIKSYIKSANQNTKKEVKLKTT